jgi:hypothetical protein
VFFTFERRRLSGMDGQRLARASLLLDALFCAALGASLVILRARLSRVLRLPGVVVAGIGVTSVGWAALVLAQALRLDWRSAAKQTAAANAAGAVALAGVAAVHPGRGGRALLALTAIEVFGFAVPLALSLVRRRGRAQEE